MDRRDVSDPKIRLNGRNLSPYVCALFGGLTALLIGSRRESLQIPLSCDLVKQDLSDDEVFHPAGVILGGRAGATMPLTDFGYALSEGAKKAVGEQGLLRAFTGGITATAGGIAAAILFGYLFALFARPKTKM